MVHYEAGRVLEDKGSPLSTHLGTQNDFFWELLAGMGLETSEAAIFLTNMDQFIQPERVSLAKKGFFTRVPGIQNSSHFQGTRCVLFLCSRRVFGLWSLWSLSQKGSRRVLTWFRVCSLAKLSQV